MCSRIENELFDVITTNLPFTEEDSSDVVEMGTYDQNLFIHKHFINNMNKYLAPGGRVYMSQANFGPLDKIFKMIENVGFNVKLIGENDLPNDPRIFYAFELTRK